MLGCKDFTGKNGREKIHNLELRGGYKFHTPIWSYKAELQLGAALLGPFGFSFVRS
jgi:hypothetical protein